MSSLSAQSAPERMNTLMRIVVICVAIALAAAVPAQARVGTIAPPGSSGISQYDETIPTAAGSRPTKTVHPGVGSHGSGGAGSAGGISARGGAVPPATQRALAASGPGGAAAAALARATAPSGSRGASTAGRGTEPSTSAVSTGTGSAPISTLLRAVTGSTSSGGNGAVLPLIFLGTLLVGAGLALRRRRRTH